MKSWVLFSLFCAAWSFRVSNNSLNSQLDGWLSDWYTPRLRFKTSLTTPLVFGWTEGSLWWKKTKTLHCPTGVLDISVVTLQRFGDVQTVKLENSTRPWMSAFLDLGNRTARFAFYNCTIDVNGEASNDNTTGSILGWLGSSQHSAIDLLLTFRSKLWYCVALTLDIAWSSGEEGALVPVDLTLSRLDSIPVSVLPDLARQLVANFSLPLLAQWKSVVGDGPTCPDEYCRVSQS